MNGTVHNADGQPLEEVVVTILESPASHPDIAALTDSAGHFSFDGLPPGTYTLQFNAGEQQVKRSFQFDGSPDTLTFELDL